jgi:hypothetical protein
MERKRTTIADYRGYLHKHLAPLFGGRPLDKIDRARVESYLLAEEARRLSARRSRTTSTSSTGSSASRSSANGRRRTRSRSSTARRRRARRTGG